MNVLTNSVSVFHGALSLWRVFTVISCILNFITGEDYTIVMERRLILSTEFPNTTITIDIVDDESDKFFLVSLSFKDQIMIPRVTLGPRFANITIRGMRLKVITIHELNILSQKLRQDFEILKTP